jgi:hypothetical protein
MRTWKGIWLALLAVALVFCGGCGGIRASRSVSPIDFLIPGGGGLMRGFIQNSTATNPAIHLVSHPVAPVTPSTALPAQ